MIRKVLHLETTNRCTLKCPACPRTIWQNYLGQPIAKADLDIDHLEHFLDCESSSQIEYFTLCGDYGDTIYYPKLYELIKRFRHKRFRIHTNGSYKTEEWWNNLNSLLSEQDEIIFAIDGLGKENEKYRINSNWDSIETGIDVMRKGPAKVTMKTLLFDFNYKKLDKFQEYADKKGIAWITEKTHRFGDKKNVPKDKEFVNTQEMFKVDYNKKEPMKIVPQCLIAAVVTSDGYFLPCDWIRNPLTFFNSELFLERSKWMDRLKISEINLDDAYEVLHEWIANVIHKGNTGQAEVLCKMKCRANA